MKQVLIKQGQAVVEEVPAPQVEPGKVLVKVLFSCISVGTEMSGVRSSGLPIWKKALQQPEKVKKVLGMAVTQGIGKTKEMVESRLASGSPTGYSAAGVVMEVGSGIDDIKRGDRVACAGAQCAFHAEYICVPRNLVVKVPDKLSLDEASTVTLGAIAMQGVRRANPTLGETFVVIGLGILGQLTVQMLAANGCRTIGIDLDSNRIELARELGLDYAVYSEDGLDGEQVAHITNGYGADGVIITAATPSDEVVSTAFKMCRKKGRVVLVGDVGLNINRADIYQKELDFFISTSYGPGRYDNKYEEYGMEYPVGYIRWTENRNMTEFVRLVSEGKIKIKPMMQSIYSIEEAYEAYECLKAGIDKPMMVLLAYPDDNSEPSRRILNSTVKKIGRGKINVALVGAGGFAKGMHLPNIKSLDSQYNLKAVMSRTGHNAQATAKQYNAEYSTTDYSEILNDPDIDLVLIATRHNLHAEMAVQALKAGKHVLVEKPLALNRQELEYIKTFYDNMSSNKQTVPILLTGFNRRFSKYARHIYDIIVKRTNPMIINYRMNAGYIPLDHWVHTDEGGGRNIGEACHIYDLFNYLTNSKVALVQAQSITPVTNYYSSRDNFVVTISYTDGSVATLTYTALGAKDYPKEKMEIFVDGKTIVMEDYKKLYGYGLKMKKIETNASEKGQREEIKELANCILNSDEWPIPLWQQLQAMDIAFKVDEHL